MKSYIFKPIDGIVNIHKYDGNGKQRQHFQIIKVTPFSARQKHTNPDPKGRKGASLTPDSDD